MLDNNLTSPASQVLIFFPIVPNISALSHV
jgi:hypothetical protein